MFNKNPRLTEAKRGEPKERRMTLTSPHTNQINGMNATQNMPTYAFLSNHMPGLTSLAFVKHVYKYARCVKRILRHVREPLEKDGLTYRFSFKACERCVCGGLMASRSVAVGIGSFCGWRANAG